MPNRDSLLYPMFDEAFKIAYLRRAGIVRYNLFSNGDFEIAGEGDPDFWADWTEDATTGVLANETVNVHEGNNAAKLTRDGTGSPDISRDIAVLPGITYDLYFYARGDTTVGSSLRYRIYDVDNSAWIVTLTTAVNDSAVYTQFTKEVVVPSGCTTIRFYFYAGVVISSCYLDTCVFE